MKRPSMDHLRTLGDQVAYVVSGQAAKDMDGYVEWLEAERTALRQALWDIYGILGFDTDGDKTPDALVHPPLIDVVVAAAREFRGDYDEAIRDQPFAASGSESGADG